MREIIIVLCAIPIAIFLKKLSDQIIGITPFLLETKHVEEEVRANKDRNIQEIVKQIDDSVFMDKLQKRGAFIKIAMMIAERNV